MQKIRTIFRKTCFSFINLLIKFKPFFSAFNYIYERAPYSFVEVINRHVVIPDRQFDWTILLYNGKKVLTRIHKNNPKTMHVALGYKWHDRGLNMLEDIITKHFKLKHPDDSFYIDCGANMGMRSITALSQGLRVVMIEPNDETNTINLERCRMNGFSNYELLTYGVSDSDGQKTFYFDESSYLSTLNADISKEEAFHVSNVLTIEVRKIDTIFSSLIGSNNKIYIKMDIEGHELEALEGAKGLIESVSPTLLIEINEKKEHINKIFDLMRSHGYTIYEKKDPEIDNKFLIPCPVNGKKQNYNSNDFLFVKDPEMLSLIKPYCYSEDE